MLAAGMLDPGTSSAQLLLILVSSSAILWLLTIFIYRWYLHPLSRFPGPKLAVTGVYEFFFDCYPHHGQFFRQLPKLHEQYGPVVRISPNELHISDVHYYDRLYNTTLHLSKDRWYYGMFNSPNSVFSAESHEHHRIRRTSLAKYFTPPAISKLEPLITSNVDRLCQLLSLCQKDNKEVNLTHAFRSCVCDIITAYVLPQPSKLLEADDFSRIHHEALAKRNEMAPWVRHFPWIIPAMISMPEWAAQMLGLRNSGAMAMTNFSLFFIRQVQEALETKEKGGHGLEQDKSRPYPVLLNELINSDDLPQEEKTMPRIIEETINLEEAALEATGGQLSMAAYLLLAHPDKLHKLLEELSTVKNGEEIISYKILENLPYLTATINETFRLVPPISGRLVRFSPDKTLIYESHAIPPGTRVSMSPSELHWNTNIFPNPDLFLPERWLEASEQRKHEMERYIMPFGRGSRQCLGMRLAWAELQMILANVLLQFGNDMELKTGIQDMETKYDWFAPGPRKGSPGLRVGWRRRGEF